MGIGRLEEIKRLAVRWRGVLVVTREHRVTRRSEALKGEETEKYTKIL